MDAKSELQPESVISQEGQPAVHVEGRIKQQEQLPADWKAAALHLVYKFGIPTTVAIIVSYVMISEGRSLLLQLSNDLKAEQTFTRDKLLDISERSIKGDAIQTEVIRQSTAQSAATQKTIEANTRVLNKALTKLEIELEN